MEVTQDVRSLTAHHKILKKARWSQFALKITSGGPLAAALVAIATLTSGCNTAPTQDAVETVNWVPVPDSSAYPSYSYFPDVYQPTIERDAAHSQNHRTPREKPPAHNLMTKPVATGRLTSGHGYRVNPMGNHEPRRHKGVDYAAPIGTPVYAAGNGVVTMYYNSKSYGNYVRIKHSNGFSTAYAHLKSFSKAVIGGKSVERGQVIGYVGNTGRSTGPHLHFELIHKGRHIDPLLEQSNTKQAGVVQKPNSG